MSILEKNNHIIVEEKNNGSLVKVNIESEMEESFVLYADSVNKSRSIPDDRDGLKPVHRRILYAMYNSGNHYNTPYRKCARITGEVMGKYHPHGDLAIYSALARMAQSYSMRAPLIDGQGNFGSIDGDSPAQMRYTEARLTPLADHCMLTDIDKNTVDFQENYDGSEEEPKVLPVLFPNLIVNGSSGIGVGIATSIPPHNMGEVIDACYAYVNNTNISIQELIKYIPGPDFPTGGEIVQSKSYANALLTGRGSITLRGRSTIEVSTIIIHDIPYQVNKSELVESISRLSKDKIILGINEIRDESNKLGVRIVIELKRDIEPEVILNQLYRLTQLQVSVSIHILALNNGKPSIMNILSIVRSFIEFRVEVITRRTRFLLNKARDRSHYLIGLLIAVENIGEIIPMIKQSKDSSEARKNLLEHRWKATQASVIINYIKDDRNDLNVEETSLLSETQVKAILEMRLHKLTSIEANKINTELEELSEEIKRHLNILQSRELLSEVIKTELLEVKKKFATNRKTTFVSSEVNLADEDFIQQEEVMILITKGGYIKRTLISNYKNQKRGGKGKNAMNINEDDLITETIIASTHDFILFFSDLGRVYRLKVYKLPVGSDQSKGRAIINVLPSISADEKITNVLTLKSELQGNGSNDYIIFATAHGYGRRSAISDFYNVPSQGKIAVKLNEDDKIIGVLLCSSKENVLIATAKGRVVRFSVENLRVLKSRDTCGVRAIRLRDDLAVSLSKLQGTEISTEERDKLLKIDAEKRIEISMLSSTNPAQAMIIARENFGDDLNLNKMIEFCKKEEFIFTITSSGYGKRTSSYEYNLINRGGHGIININLKDKTAKVVSSFPILNNAEIIVLTDSGTVIRTHIKSVRITGRRTYGVRIINLKKREGLVSSVSKIEI